MLVIKSQRVQELPTINLILNGKSKVVKQFKSITVYPTQGGVAFIDGTNNFPVFSIEYEKDSTLMKLFTLKFDEKYQGTMINEFVKFPKEYKDKRFTLQLDKLIKDNTFNFDQFISDLMEKLESL